MQYRISKKSMLLAGLIVLASGTRVSQGAAHEYTNTGSNTHSAVMLTLGIIHFIAALGSIQEECTKHGIPFLRMPFLQVGQ